jgi:hypothetical protein
MVVFGTDAPNVVIFQKQIGFTGKTKLIEILIEIVSKGRRFAEWDGEF